MKTHKEFMEKVEEAVSIPAQTKKALSENVQKASSRSEK